MIKKLFSLAVFVLSVQISRAQQQSGLHGSSTTIQTTDKSVIGGHFDMDRRNEQNGKMELMNVNYGISPAPFDKVLHLELGTVYPTLFSADIVDEKGKTIKHWAPLAKRHIYSEAIDISVLVPGNYKVNIYTENSTAVLHTISFKKEPITKN